MDVKLWMAIPFALMLAIIAAAPLAFPHFWEKNKNKLIVVLALSIPTAIFLSIVGFGENLIHQMLFEYFPFITLLLALFVVTGGIQIKGNVVATTETNAIILTLGFILASLMGTTGASMLLIRPLLDINRQRVYRTHTVLFFIAMVANCGGILTPLGDPPLFLLYLRGAPFTWFSTLFTQWIFVGVLLLIAYVIMDKIYFKKESISAKRRDMKDQSPIRIKGKINFIYLGVIILSVMFINPSYIPAMEDGPIIIKFLREYILIAMVILSLATTKKVVRKTNHFTWDAINEVAIIFVGIFVTMTPAMMYLNQNADSLNFTEVYQYYYATGLLSAFLDNSPTAIAFYELASGMDMSNIPAGELTAGIPTILLKAISLAAVFFGSLTYIGNGPNFMVKSIAEEEGVKMPSFFGYMAKFSLVILLPIYIIVQLIFIGF